MKSVTLLVTDFPTRTNFWRRLRSVTKKKSCTSDPTATVGRWCYRPHQLPSDPRRHRNGEPAAAPLCLPLGFGGGAFVNIVRPATGQGDRGCDWERITWCKTSTSACAGKTVVIAGCVKEKRRVAFTPVALSLELIMIIMAAIDVL